MRIRLVEHITWSSAADEDEAKALAQKLLEGAGGGDILLDFEGVRVVSPNFFLGLFMALKDGGMALDRVRWRGTSKVTDRMVERCRSSISAVGKG